MMSTLMIASQARGFRQHEGTAVTEPMLPVPSAAAVNACTARRSSAELDDICAAIAALLGVPIVLISVVEAERQSFIGSHGIAAPIGESPPDGDRSPLCFEVALTAAPIVEDAQAKLPAAALNGWRIDYECYAGVPLLLRDGTCIGTVAAFAPSQRVWQRNDLLVLRGFADAAVAIIEGQRPRSTELTPVIEPAHRSTLRVIADWIRSGARSLRLAT